VRWSGGAMMMRAAAPVGGIGVRFRGRREFSCVKISYKVYWTNATFPHIFKVIIRRDAKTKKNSIRSIDCLALCCGSFIFILLSLFTPLLCIPSFLKYGSLFSLKKSSTTTTTAPHEFQRHSSNLLWIVRRWLGFTAI
jgi:hypothetical protein